MGAICVKVGYRVTIVNVLTDQMYNDLGFTVGNRLMILVEAQSTWSENIIVRALMYLAESYRDLLDEQGQNLYGSKKITLPEPELYVIYSGDRQNRPEHLTLSKEFFGGRKTALEVTVKVLYGEDATNVIGQYVRFCKVFNMVTKQYGLTDFAVQELIRICKDEDVLKAYLEAREKEVTSIMISLFNEDAIQKAYGREKHDEGFTEGIVIGEAKGRAEGRDEQAKASAIRMYLRGMPTNIIADILGYGESVVDDWTAGGALA